MSTTTNVLTRDLYILEDENNPQSSKSNLIYPSTIIDQVIDNESPIQRTLRDVLNDIRNEIVTGGKENLIFPVTSVNGLQGDVTITPRMLGLENVDNTRDIDKPMSDIQRAELEKRLATFKPEVDLSELYEHIADKSNPHNVTIEQLNTGGYIDGIMNSEISAHNTNKNTHQDIRDSIVMLSSELSDLRYTSTINHTTINNAINKHLNDAAPHASVLNKKEDLSNKSSNLDNPTQTTYPTTRAVVEYVAVELQKLHDSLNDPSEWLDDILVINDRSKLPEADECYIHKVYFIRNGVGAQSELAICRQLADDSYSWDITQYGPVSRFNNDHFIDSIEGMKININEVTNQILEAGSSAIADITTETINTQLQHYYTKQDIDDMKLVSNIKIVTGTMNGCIRYYINNDPDTMSDDIRISGLQKLAFMERITGDEIEFNTIWGDHLADDCIQARHMSDKSVNASNLTADYGTVFGNIHDELNQSVKAVPLQELADAIQPLLHDVEINLEIVTNDQIVQYVNDAYNNV